MLRFIGPQCKPTRLCLDLMVGQEEVLCDPVPWLTIVMALLVPLRPEIIVVKLSNQKVNILTGVGHGLFFTRLEDPPHQETYHDNAPICKVTGAANHIH